MTILKQLIALSAVAAITAACTASVRGMPGPDDTNRVVARDIEKHGAERAAFRAAIAYCEDHGKEALFISDRVWYEGAMDEDRRAEIRRQSEAATVLGGIMRSSDDQDSAVIFESAGAVGSTVTSGKDYTAEIRFRCRLS
jgi:hypothetical protein